MQTNRVKTEDFYEIYSHSPNQLRAALTLGPVAVTVDADSQAWRNYETGVINSYSCYS